MFPPLQIRVKPAVYHCVTKLEADHLDNTPKRNVLATEPIAFDGRTRRVLELRRQIAEGTYRVDHRGVAAAILRERFAIEAVFAPTASTTAAGDPTRDFSRFLITPVPRDLEETPSVTAIA